MKSDEESKGMFSLLFLASQPYLLVGDKTTNAGPGWWLGGNSSELYVYVRDENCARQTPSSSLISLSLNDTRQNVYKNQRKKQKWNRRHTKSMLTIMSALSWSCVGFLRSAVKLSNPADPAYDVFDLAGSMERRNKSSGSGDRSSWLGSGQWDWTLKRWESTNTIAWKTCQQAANSWQAKCKLKIICTVLTAKIERS
jgi:hypothetical protein